MWERTALAGYEPVLNPAAGATKQLLVAGAVDVLSHPALYSLPSAIPALGLGETRYHAPETPRAMHPASAALLSAALAAEPEALRARQRIEQWYDSSLATATRATLALLEGCESGALRYPVRLHVERAWPLVSLGVARSYPRTLGEYGPIHDVLRARTSMPGATELAATLHTLPTHALLGEQERLRIVRSISEP